jgi:hypothetical protein
MGDIIGGLIGGVGSLAGGKKAKNAALTGYRYLTGKNGVQSYVDNGRNANTGAYDALTNPNSTAFKNYLSSTGYNFQKQQGTAAITGSAAARGLLGSGSTAKALSQYGNNLASTGFDNYLSHLGDISKQGLEASGQIGEAGTSGGATAAKALQSATDTSSGIFGTVGNKLYNYFGGV